MKKAQLCIKVDGKKYKIPDSWSDVTLRQYQKLSQLSPSFTDSQRLTEIISILLDVDFDEFQLLQIPYTTLKEVEAVLSFINTVEPPEKPYDRFTIDGIEYGLEPNFTTICGGVFSDCLKRCTPDSFNMIELIAILYRPIITKRRWFEAKTKQYKIEDYDAITMKDRAELFADKLTADMFYGATLFFSTYGKESTQIMQHFLAAKNENIQKMKNPKK